MDAIDMALDIARPAEGFYPYPYICPAGKVTIGYGSTFYQDGSPIRLTDPPFTREQAEALLRWEMERCERQTLLLCPSLSVNANQLAAITDFVYNLGAGRLAKSTLRKRILSGDLDDVPAQLRKWVYGGGRILPGLVKRREAEIQLFTRGPL